MNERMDNWIVFIDILVMLGLVKAKVIGFVIEETCLSWCILIFLEIL